MTGMKKIVNISILACLISFFFIGSFTSCKDEADLVLPRLFRPIGFNVSTNKTVATFSWAAVDSAVSYSLKVSNDSLNFNKLVIDTTLTSLSYVQELAGSTKFFARIYANAKDTTKNSRFNTLSFKTPAENIFSGYGTNTNTGKLYSAYMTDIKTLNVKWTPGAKVTNLTITSADGATSNSLVISSSEDAAGEKTISSLANSNWTIKIYNNAILRGTTTGLVEGDVVLKSGDDLPTAITNAIAGQVILLPAGAVFPMGTTTYRLGKSVKVRGLSFTNRPVICPSTGASATASPLGFVDASTIDYVRFENIDFTGYCANNTAGIKAGYLINNNTFAKVKSLSFTNCNLHNFGNTPMRVQGNKNQVVDTLSFNGCVINDIGFASTYAIVNSNSADFINTINFNNCTVYNFRGSLVSRTTQTLNSINVTNCTFNQGMQEAGTSVRFFIDTNNAAFTGSGINIKNCIIGSSGTMAGGIRFTSTIGKLLLANSYFTNDYKELAAYNGVDYSTTLIKGRLTAYSGASTALWNNPVTGDFSFKDATFVGKGVAGDLRW